jgi:hypothetical protein
MTHESHKVSHTSSYRSNSPTVNRFIQRHAHKNEFVTRVSARRSKYLIIKYVTRQNFTHTPSHGQYKLLSFRRSLLNVSQLDKAHATYSDEPTSS